MALYPISNAYDKGRFAVGDGYELYYELVGNPKGIPVVFLHGGPGAGFSKEHRQFFNPKKFNVLLFTQRGAPGSKPFASTKNNNTQKLMDDVRVLSHHFFGDRKVVLFGGSWGSTLALAYALSNPKTVSGMVLRGIFLCSEQENKEFFVSGAKNNYPDAWERFASHVPKRARNDWRAIVSFYEKKFRSKNPKMREFYTREWARYEYSMLSLDTSEKYVKDRLKDGSYKSTSPLEAHFTGKMCFLPKDYIIKNAHKLSGIPTRIVHGRFDHVCRPIDAWRLHKEIKGSKLYFVPAAHSAHDANMKETLKEQMDELGALLSKRA